MTLKIKTEQRIVCRVHVSTNKGINNNVCASLGLGPFIEMKCARVKYDDEKNNK